MSSVSPRSHQRSHRASSWNSTMPSCFQGLDHAAEHNACSSQSRLLPAADDLLQIGSRRWFLRTGLAGFAGLSLAGTLKLQAATSGIPGPHRDPRAVILFWLSGGPSHLDTWDPKPEAPVEIRGPYRTI